MGNSVKERFYEVMEILNLTDYRVYTDIEGITKNMMVKLRNGETSEVSTKILMPFLNTYKNVNANYILTGRGNAIIEDEDTDGVSPNMPTTPTITSIPTTNKDIKILDIRVCAGQGIGFDGDENEIIGYVNIPEFAGCYGITVYGDSMYDMYMSGDTIFVREIKDKHNIDNGQPYVIITKEDRLLKMIHIDYERKRTILSSYNNATNPDGKRKYPDMEIDIDSDVLFLYKVVGKLARTQM
ncbi:S24 family peptidase [Bacteroides clarus]|uniref:S24 family peptidase n=1 Tax=Bacteroides clarus TaxID=626929 RepID=UPI002492E688|nr:S24 family peptidase [Bacteroides clarus]